MIDIREKQYLYSLIKAHWLDYTMLVRKESEPTKGKNCLYCGKDLGHEAFFFCFETGAVKDVCVYSWLLKHKDTLLEWITK